MDYDTSKLASLQTLKDTATRIKKEYLSAIAKSGHGSFKKADTVPTVEEAQPDVMYYVKNEKTGHYDIYALIDGAVEWLDDTTVDLEGYVTDDELSQAIAEALEETVVTASDEEVNEMFNDVFGSDSTGA